MNLDSKLSEIILVDDIKTANVYDLAKIIFEKADPEKDLEAIEEVINKLIADNTIKIGKSVINDLNAKGGLDLSQGMIQPSTDIVDETTIDSMKELVNSLSLRQVIFAGIYNSIDSIQDRVSRSVKISVLGNIYNTLAENPETPKMILDAVKSYLEEELEDSVGDGSAINMGSASGKTRPVDEIVMKTVGHKLKQNVEKHEDDDDFEKFLKGE